LDNSKKAIKTVFISFLANILLALIKGIAGFFGNSYALIADAIESTTDIFSSFIVWLGLKYANKPADKEHPYGHGKIEPLITFVVVGFLIVSATIIAYESVIHIQTPHDLPEAWTLYILGSIILWKEVSYQYMIRKAKELNSSSVRADAWHHRSDALTSLAAFVGILIALVGGKGFESADDWAALLASFFILYNSYLIFRPALGEILDEHQYDELVEEIREKSLLVDGIKATEKCFVRKSGMKYHLELHVKVDAHLTVLEGHAISHVLKDYLKENMPSLEHVLIHIEPFSEEISLTNF
jgi:cation diffusion facilitator family transporter